MAFICFLSFSASHLLFLSVFSETWSNGVQTSFTVTKSSRITLNFYFSCLCVTDLLLSLISVKIVVCI